MADSTRALGRSQNRLELEVGRWRHHKQAEQLVCALIPVIVVERSKWIGPARYISRVWPRLQ